MRAFAALFARLDSTASTLEKVEAMRDYFANADPADSAWALYFLSGRRLKRFIRSAELRAWAQEEAKISTWLFEECRAATGDTAETCALILDTHRAGRSVSVPSDVDLSLAEWMDERIAPLSGKSVQEQKAAVTTWWAGLSREEILILAKLLTGSFRVGASKGLAARAVALYSGVPEAEIARRLMGERYPTAADFKALISKERIKAADSSAYPFFLASPLAPSLVSEETLAPLNLEAEFGPTGDWLVEFKWDGIRAQMVRRGGETYIWTRGEELATERFPELTEAAKRLPDGIAIDGEIVAYASGKPLSFAALQTRIGRKSPNKDALARAPIAFIAYDLLELDGKDIREAALSERRAALRDLLLAHGSPFLFSEGQTGANWADFAKLRSESRDRGVEGLMLKRLSSPYRSGRRRGDWWKWKIEPRTTDAVLMYAQAGSGRRANLFTDYTFGVWRGEELVPIAKAYSGLNDKEIATLDNWIRRNAVERFGPTRALPHELVFEIAFEAIQASSRHKSGLALRFPRILRARKDKKPADADRIETLQAMAADDRKRSSAAIASEQNPELEREDNLNLFSWSAMARSRAAMPPSEQRTP